MIRWLTKDKFFNFLLSKPVHNNTWRHLCDYKEQIYKVQKYPMQISIVQELRWYNGVCCKKTIAFTPWATPLVPYQSSQVIGMHYSDVIMGTIASQITSLTIVYSTIHSDAEKIKAPRHWPLCGEFTGDRWIPHINGQYRWKRFHLMTSSR